MLGEIVHRDGNVPTSLLPFHPPWCTMQLLTHFDDKRKLLPVSSLSVLSVSLFFFFIHILRKNIKKKNNVSCGFIVFLMLHRRCFLWPVTFVSAGVALHCPHCFIHKHTCHSFSTQNLFYVFLQFLTFFFFFFSSKFPSFPLSSMHLTPHVSILRRPPWPPVEDCTVSMAVL